MLDEPTWPPEAVRFRSWDSDRAVWRFRTTVTHRPAGGNSTLTLCGLDWLGSHTVNVAGPATCKRCAARLTDPKGATDGVCRIPACGCDGRAHP